MLEYLAKSKNVLRSGFLLSVVFFSLQTVSAGSYLDPSRILFERPTAAVQLEIIDCYINGNCKEDNKIRIYPMPCNGSNGADCTGCYALRGNAPVRIGDLNPSGTCAGVGADSEQKLRVFVGYERNCPGVTTVGASCTNGQLLLGCSISSEGGTGPEYNWVSYDKECFGGTPYIRQARSAKTIVTVTPSAIPTWTPACEPGTTGTYPNCTSCSDTSYKAMTGNGACTECTPPAINHSETFDFSTAGTTKTSPNDCRVSFTCLSPYLKNVATQSCDSPTLYNGGMNPSPSPSPSPSPTPTSPPRPTCANANFILNVVSVELYAPGSLMYNLKLSVGWDGIFSRTDFARIVGVKDGVTTNVNLTGLFGGSNPRTIQPLLSSAGDYYFHFEYQLYGEECPPTIPVLIKAGGA